MSANSVITGSEIRHILRDCETGDFLAVYSKGKYGRGIRIMLSRGLHKCYTNHNAPVWRHPQTNEPMMLQIEPPEARVQPLAGYLADLFANGGAALLLRPDAYKRPYEGGDGRRFEQALKWLIEEWEAMEGVPYDTPSIRMILRRIFRYARHKTENTKEKIYCTEGTLYPYMHNPYVEWRPDILINESYPAPIHAEHIIRQGRVQFIAGSSRLYRQIMEA